MEYHRASETCESVEPFAASQSSDSNKFRRHSSASSDTTRTIRRDTRSFRITFSTVNVHHHELICGDNPSVSDGVPLQLDWETNDSETFDIDTYEKIACDKQVRRLSAVERAIIAGESNTKSFLEKVREEVLLIQGSRQVSMKDTKFKSKINIVSSRRQHEAVSPSVLTARGTEYTNWF